MGQFDLNLPLLREDENFIKTCLSGQTQEVLAAALVDYEFTWRKASDAESLEHKKDNAGRRAANTFLREIICPSLYVTTKNAA